MFSRFPSVCVPSFLFRIDEKSQRRCGTWAFCWADPTVGLQLLSLSPSLSFKSYGWVVSDAYNVQMSPITHGRVRFDIWTMHESFDTYKWGVPQIWIRYVTHETPDATMEIVTNSTFEWAKSHMEHITTSQPFDFSCAHESAPLLSLVCCIELQCTAVCCSVHTSAPLLWVFGFLRSFVTMYVYEYTYVRICGYTHARMRVHTHTRDQNADAFCLNIEGPPLTTCQLLQHTVSVLQCSKLQRLPLTQHNNSSPYSHICVTYKPVRSRSTFDPPQQFEPLAQLLYSELLRCNLLQCVTASCSMSQCVVVRRLPNCSILCCCPVCYCEWLH